MYLIKVSLPLKNAYPLLADCQKMHKFVTAIFNTDRQTSQILYRTQHTPTALNVYMYANRPAEPNRCSYRLEQKDISPALSAIQPGQHLGFDLVALPSKKVSTGGRTLSQRRCLGTEEERMNWLNRKAADCGFEIICAAEQSKTTICGKHEADHGGKMQHAAFHYQGVLCVTDPAAFQDALQKGIGPGKAYGLGMLCLARCV